jgi:lysophospholipase L1-like esterase
VKEALARIVLVLVSTILTVAVLELVARVFLDRTAQLNFTPVPASIRTGSAIPGIPYLMRPNASAVHELQTDTRGYFDEGATLTYRINSLGFRGNEISREKPLGVFRIVGLGDSFTFGTGVRNEDTFLARLEDTLNRAEGKNRFQVVNLGMMGFNTVQEVSLLRHFGLPLDPDLILITFHLNDVRSGSHFRTGKPSSNWRKHSRLIDHLAERWRLKLRAMRNITSYQADFREDSPQWIEARLALKEAKALSARHGAQLVLVIFPLLLMDDDGYLFEGIHTTVANAAMELNIPVLDLFSAFSDFVGSDLWVHRRNHHPNEKGHAIAAEAIHRFLVENQFLRQSSASAPPTPGWASAPAGSPDTRAQ